MDLWFSEKHTPDVKLSIRIEKQLFSQKSDYQRIDVFESREVRKTDLEVVCHTILELVPEAWLVELRGLEVDSVLE